MPLQLDHMVIPRSRSIDTGREFRHYEVSDLIDYQFLLDHGLGFPAWEASHHMDATGMKLYVTTRQSDEFVFNMATGEIVSSVRMARRYAFGLVFVLFLAAALVGKRLHRRRKRAKSVESVDS